ncbi:CPBP family intramembrane metalloprotease [Lactobacillus helveticus]|uniref:CPBP family intramembrane glutamic endopeptidase n=1 Tax=Lactobacillus helveticus TaxID=1587 RepID=UPI001C64E02A|nr:CPBP family intramembrane glutamic endopeptidase [Lactobacillus helveticus]MBW8014512.1 CPBP family intramembrane metalloprotease [Lactobacillus helveticus]
MEKIKNHIRTNKLGQRLIYLVLAIISFAIYVFVQLSFTISRTKQISFGKLFLIIVVGIFGIIMIAVCYDRQLYRQNEWKFYFTYKINLKSVGIVIGSFFVIIVSQIMLLTVVNPPHTSINQEILNKLLSKTNPLFYVMLGIIAPICEELIFRGMFFEILFIKPSRRNLILGSICNGLLFAVIHDQNLDVFFLAYFIAGFILALQYLLTKNISTPILTHMANNLITLII